MKKNERIECEIESLAYGGRGVAKVAAPEEGPGEGAMVVFVERGLPGSRVRVRLDKVKKRFAEGFAEAVLRPSPDAVEPFCPHFGTCGGCAFQDLSYERQVAEKQRQIVETMARVGRVEFPEVLDLIPSPETRGYRGKMEYAFSGQGRGLKLGLKERKGWAVVDLKACGLMAGSAESDNLAMAIPMQILEAVRAFCHRGGLPAWDARTGQGYLRHLVLKRSRSEQAFLAQIITTGMERHHSKMAALADRLLEAFPALKGVVHSERRSKVAMAFGEVDLAVFGEDHLDEVLTVAGRPVRYRISAGGFFQPNPGAAEKLYELVRAFAVLKGTEILADLYCGSGGVALALAPDLASSSGKGGGKVIGLDSVEDAVAEARISAREAGLDNAEFVRADLETGRGMPASLDEGGKVDVVVADPPRGGLSEGAVERVLAMAPERLVLVSCDPPALARDVARLSEAYAPAKLGGVDLFPHTPHVEAVALLTRCS